MDTSHPVGIGTDFLGYRIEELIGRGGMGVVYRAYDLRLKRPVALKLVAPSLARDERFRERFARESELVMSLEHPNVVPIYDAGDVDGRVYLAMRLVDGRDLGSLLRTEGALEPARAIAVCSQIAAALDAAHARGLVHRDVKPSNVLLDSSEHVYLADFGLTRQLDDEEGGAGGDFAVGTPAYLAPEQLDRGQVDRSTDIYSLGCVLYECLTGEPVFVRSSRLAVAWAHLEDEPPRTSERRPELPSAIDAVVGRALSKEPERRYPSCGALVAAAGDATGLGSPRPAGGQRRLLLAGVGVLAIALAASVAGVLSRGGSGKPAPLLAGENTLARIDTATNTVSDVIPVGAEPVIVAASDYTVWAYSRADGQISQVSVVTNRVEERTPVSLPAECCSLFTGPVLAADASGAWFVDGGFGGRKAELVHVPVGPYGKQSFPLPITPTGIGVSKGAVWVVGHDSRGDAVLRIDEADGRVTDTARFPLSAKLDSIAYGFGAVWAMSSAKAKLYRLDPQALRHVRSVRVARTRATRPEIMAPRGNDIFVSVTGGGGETYSIAPSSLNVTPWGSYGAPGNEENIGNLGSLWWYDWTTGNLYRQEVAGNSKKTIPVTRPLPKSGGPCITSMVEGGGSIWAAVAPSHHSTCTR